jgi:hypothetical protein
MMGRHVISAQANLSMAQVKHALACGRSQNILLPEAASAIEQALTVMVENATLIMKQAVIASVAWQSITRIMDCHVAARLAMTNGLSFHAKGESHFKGITA